MAKSRYPDVVEKGKCRGCGAPVPKGRRTWCSNECWEPHTVIGRHRVLLRDKVCQICGFEILLSIKNHEKALHDWWNKNCAGDKPKEHPQSDYEIDHILPHSEGGKTRYENLRLLCIICHKKRTAAWHKERKARGSKQMELPGQ